MTMMSPLPALVTVGRQLRSAWQPHNQGMMVALLWNSKSPNAIFRNNNMKRHRSSLVYGNFPERGVSVEVGQHAQLERIFTIEEVKEYGNLIGDLNPLHQAGDLLRTDHHQHHNTEKEDWYDALHQAGLIQWEEENGHTRKVLVHGMLVSSLFSSIFATLCPGAVYLSQEIQFRAPIFCHDKVTACIEVTKVRKARRQPGIMVTCQTHITCHQRMCVQGMATVWLPTGSSSSSSQAMDLV